MSTERDIKVYEAKLAEQAERYDEMVKAMRTVAMMGVELSVEERNLLSVAYKNVIGARRASWRIINSIEQKEESKGNKLHAESAAQYRSQIEKELVEICTEILDLLDVHLKPSSEVLESKVFYSKIYGMEDLEIATQLDSILSCTTERSTTISVACGFYKADVNAEQLDSKIQQYLASSDLNNPTPNTILKLFAENRTLADLFPSLTSLLRIHFALPCTTCEADRAFIK